MVRIALAEKGLPVQLKETAPWADSETLTALDPAGSIPILVDEPPTGGAKPISPINAIFEYLEEVYAAPRLLPATSAARADTRQLCAWISVKFEKEVIALSLRERIDKRLSRAGGPDYDRLEHGRAALAWHMDYFEWLLGQRAWFATETFSYADIAAAGALSALDYIGAVKWDDFPAVREWYARVKSRPSMRPLLNDRIEGVPPPAHYDDPDF